MKASQVPYFTLKEDPKDAVVTSHRLLTRAGFIRKQAAGLYVYLPFAQRVLRKIETIIREEMDAAGGVEVQMPVITPAELWETSGRYSTMGAEMMRLSDRHSAGFVLGPTHEESVTWLAQSLLKSYKQLPITIYQIGTKYRDEIRPRYGLIRCREFIMKDAYSFHLDTKSLDDVYERMRVAYRNIFSRCGLDTIPVEADSGNMGGSDSEEFMVASEIGEETLLLCADQEKCGYRSNQEKTAFIPAIKYPEGNNDSQPERVNTPNVKTVEEVSNFLHASPDQFIKTVILENEDEIVVAFVPGDREASVIKIKNAAHAGDLDLASSEAVEAITGAEPGFAGPYDLKTPPEPTASEKPQIITYQKARAIAASDGIRYAEKRIVFLYDKNLKGRSGLISGGNASHTHYLNLKEGRDFTMTEFNTFDLIAAEAGDLCPRCGNPLNSTKGIEVGHIFKLGKKYTTALEVEVLGEDGRPHTPEMGTYGVGVGRTMATVVEQNHDEHGIIWPVNIAPFEFALISLTKSEEDKAKVDDLYERMLAADMEVFYDNRDERPGVKFNDAELAGFPFIIIAGKTFIENNVVEFKDRRTGEKREMTVESLLPFRGE